MTAREKPLTSLEVVEEYRPRRTVLNYLPHVDAHWPERRTLRIVTPLTASFTRTEQ